MSLKLVSFDPIRTFDIPGVKGLKADKWKRYLHDIRAADWVLFPEHWQVNFLVYGQKKRIFPSVPSYHLGYSKIDMTYAFQSVCPENVPYTLIMPRTETAVDQILEEMPLPCVAKEVRNSMGRGVFLIETREELEAYAAVNPMLYVQEYLPIDRDVRVVWVGDRVVLAYWRIAPQDGFHNNVARGGTISFEDVPETAVHLAATAAQELGINHAGFDVAMVDGKPYLLEFNMRFGTAALRQQNIRLGPIIYNYLLEHQ